VRRRRSPRSRWQLDALTFFAPAARFAAHAGPRFF
jgi:hypothetical protein